MPMLDQWLAQVFDPANLEETVALMLSASESTEGADAKMEAARRKIADCDDRLGKYRAALDSGADPSVVAEWMSEVQAEKLKAQAVQVAERPSEALSARSLRSMIEGLSEMAQVLAEADPKDKAEVYSALGIEVTYSPDLRILAVTSRPLARGQQSVSEGGLRRSSVGGFPGL